MSTANKQLTTCPKKTAVAYARYSSAQQRDVSIEQQLNDIRAYAAREGYTIIYEYADHAKSGFSHVERRSEFQSMLIAASSGAVDTVIAWKVDRFGRNRKESAIYKSQLADNGVSVVYAMEPIPDGAAGVLTEGMLEAIAEWYSRNLSENVRRGQTDNAMKCISNGQAVTGYKKGPDNHYEIEESGAAIVRRIFTMYSQGYSYASIARALNADGLRGLKGKPFESGTVRGILKNERYIGVYHFGKVRIPGGCPAIIDMDLWEKCQEQMKKTTRHREKSPVTFYLSGKCFCGKCGSVLYGNHGLSRKHERYYYYVCKARHKDKNACTFPNMRKEKIESRIFDFLFNQVMKGDLLDDFINQIADVLVTRNSESPLKALEKEYSDTIRKINNINLAISEGIWTESTGSLLNSLTERRDSLDKKIAYHRLTDDKEITKDRIQFYMHKITTGERENQEYLRTLASSLINSITVYDGWLRVVVNAEENVGQIPPDELPPLAELPDLSCLGQRACSASCTRIPQPYPVVIFKIAI